MIKTEFFTDGRKHTWSDERMMIRQSDTGILYEDAVDTVEHMYLETNIPISSSEEATAEDYEAALNKLGVVT